MRVPGGCVAADELGAGGEGVLGPAPDVAPCVVVVLGAEPNDAPAPTVGVSEPREDDSKRPATAAKPAPTSPTAANTPVHAALTVKVRRSRAAAFGVRRWSSRIAK